MKDAYFDTAALVKLQRYLWLALTAAFAVMTVLYVADSRWSHQVALVGVPMVLMATLVEILFIANQFRRARLRHLQILSYLLVFVLCAIVLWKALLA